MFEKYFSYTYKGEPFILFSWTHLIMLVLTLLILGFLIIFRRTLQKTKNRFPIKWSIIILLILSEISLNIWYVSTGAWNIQETLPLQLCTISLILSVFMLLFKSYKLFEVVYFLGIAGAIQALLTPELFFGFPHYRFFHFFIAHMAIVFASVYMVLIENYRPTVKSIWRAMLALNIIAFFVFIINKIIGSNYMFLAHKPDNPSLLDYLPSFPWYILYLELIALGLFILLYLPFLFPIKNTRERK
ncbi:putative integral membrane protein (TIGR02206 family) [Salirhabdus euzebyi]|uniref:Putative integral membrane protein (TIGR02206 family) n=1 Tax=Salirhabdus euzebyi TaxID=394506 RepID=A0A841Q8U2_9BACI|nr:TIGR02206 family membrane protein [Salirhabdus euzebyi]MBB6454816.1 putative integral membrane protein (TIGR02206 family) [Salirhabdus euzebyi]